MPGGLGRAGRPGSDRHVAVYRQRMPAGCGRAGRQVGHSHSVCRQLQQLPRVELQAQWPSSARARESTGVELPAQQAELRAREPMDARAGREQMPAERGRERMPGERGGAGYSRESAAEVDTSRRICPPSYRSPAENARTRLGRGPRGGARCACHGKQMTQCNLYGNLHAL